MIILKNCYFFLVERLYRNITLAVEYINSCHDIKSRNLDGRGVLNQIQRQHLFFSKIKLEKWQSKLWVYSGINFSGLFGNKSPVELIAQPFTPCFMIAATKIA